MAMMPAQQGVQDNWTGAVRDRWRQGGIIRERRDSGNPVPPLAGLKMVFEGQVYYKHAASYGAGCGVLEP